MLTPGPHWDLIATFAVTLILMPVLIALAPGWGLVDHPNQRKQHAGSIPLVGGAALFIGMAITLAIRHGGLVDVRVMLLSGGMLVVMGLLDDLKGLSQKPRFVVQIIASLVMVFGAGVVLNDFGELVWPSTLHLGWFAIPVTVFCVVGVTNAVNMIDGMDGLSGSLSLVTLGGLWVALLHAGVDVHAYPALPALMGGLLGYLLFNFPLPWRKGGAMAFFGDAGTLFIGFALAWMLVQFSQGQEQDQARIIAPVTALWLLAVPLLDTVFVMIKRKLAGLSMIEADREHIHHAFLRSGRSVPQTLFALIVAAVGCAGAGLVMEWYGVPEYVSYAAFLGLAAVYYASMSSAWNNKRFLGNPIQ